MPWLGTKELKIRDVLLLAVREAARRAEVVLPEEFDVDWPTLDAPGVLLLTDCLHVEFRGEEFVKEKATTRYVRAYVTVGARPRAARHRE